MEVRRGFESRSFDEAIHQQLRPAALLEARRLSLLTNSYVVQGEYGRILSAYLDVFPREQMWLGLSRFLEETPESVVRSILEYLDVDTEYRPSNRHFRGGLRNRIPREAELELRRYLSANVWPLLGADAKRHRRAFYVWLEEWRVEPDDAPVPVSLDTRDALSEHFREDAELLFAMTGFDTPWRRFSPPSTPSL